MKWSKETHLVAWQCKFASNKGWCYELFKGWYLIRMQKSDRLFVKNRAIKFMKEYFGNALETNNKDNMSNRRMGFEDGYLAALKDLGLKFRYIKK